MRRGTARKVLAVFLFAVPAVLVVDGRKAARGVLAAGLIVGFFLLLVWFRKKPRQEAMRTEARRMRLRHSVGDPFALLDEPFALFRRTRGSYAEIGNVIWGSWHDLEVRIFDYVYSGPGNEDRRLSCALAAIPGGWPTLVIQPERLLTKLADHLALPDIEFESEPFNLAFDVGCPERRFASAVVDARMMEWLLSLGDGWGFEIQGRWILGHRDQVQPWEIDVVPRTVEAFIERIPRAVRSLYPEALPPRPDVLA